MAMNIKLIKTEEDYQIALKRLEVIFDAQSGIIESDEADILGLMIDEYEKKHYPIEAPDPIEAIKIRMEELNLKQVDLADTIGGKNRVSEIMNRKRKLTVEMIRNLTGRLNLSPGLLIHDYKLTGQKRALTSRKVARHAMTNKKSLNITRTV
jgi:HTH-type transcriptional regulator/antitoxin HigA